MYEALTKTIEERGFEDSNEASCQNTDQRRECSENRSVEKVSSIESAVVVVVVVSLLSCRRWEAEQQIRSDP